jgi:hypothetical protein
MRSPPLMSAAPQKYNGKCAIAKAKIRTSRLWITTDRVTRCVCQDENYRKSISSVIISSTRLDAMRSVHGKSRRSLEGTIELTFQTMETIDVQPRSGFPEAYS